MILESNFEGVGIVLAVSGGIDSMCLMHMFKDRNDTIVAHFNHGTRPSADDDEKFVQREAKKYGLPFYVGKANLGPNVSEAEARDARYKFLRRLAKKHNSMIITAHHANDFCESIVINILRGTGWRGIMPMVTSEDIARPLLSWTKSRIYQYAADNNIVFRQDPTNSEDNYLRNRIRPKVAELYREHPIAAETFFVMALRQDSLRQQIEAITSELLPFGNTYERALFDNIDDSVAEELLREVLKRANISATRPQIYDFLHAIRTYQSGKKFNLPKGRLVKFNKTEFML
ncbi:tRNA lysidine(34) synthetase TilS [Candidatus Saccharibacteria bacterium]|nr:tRNA lysidine(34) synthetase TilS [Candidatus Saccharibacteria bacterium]